MHARYIAPTKAVVDAKLGHRTFYIFPTSTTPNYRFRPATTTTTAWILRVLDMRRK